MDYTFSLQELTPSTRQFKVELSKEGFNQKFESAVQKAARTASIKGFRPGKVPPAMVKKLYGEQVRRDLLDELFQKAYSDAVAKHELHVVGIDEVKVEDGEAGGITVHAQLALMPSPTLEGYKSVAAEVTVEEFTAEKLEEEIASIREMHGKLEAISDREVTQKGDVAEIQFRLEKDGQPIEGITTESQMVALGDGRFLPEAEDQIIGMKVGEEKRFIVTLPKDFAMEHLREQPVDFICNLNGVHSLTLPELNDEFAKETGLGETVAEMHEKVESILKRAIEDRNREKKLRAALAEIAKSNPFEIPQAMIDEEIRNLLVERKIIDPKKIDPRRLDAARLRPTFGEEAEERVRRGILLDRIEELEALEVSVDEVRQWLDKRFESQPMLKEYYASDEKLLRSEKIQAGARRDKVLNLILDGATFKEVAAEKA